MKKVLKIVGSIFLVLILLGLIFFAVDYNKVKNNEQPMFCVNLITYKDGGTKEYFGLGYKVIDFQMLNGYQEMKIGTYFMKYEDFEEEYKAYDEKLNFGEMEEGKKIEELPKSYSPLQAAKDGCFVITNDNKLYQKEKLNAFFLNTWKDIQEKKDSFLRIVQYTKEGDPIISDVSYNAKEDEYTVKIDRTRDKFAEEKNRKIEIKENLSGKNYTSMISIGKEEIRFGIVLHTGEREQYPDYMLASYSNKAIVEKTYPEFYGKVLQVNQNFLLIEVAEGESFRTDSDKVMVSPKGEKGEIYQVGDSVKVSYTGEVRDSYPASIDCIAIKKIEDFDFIVEPNKEEKVNTILIKGEIESCNYTVYGYGGEVKVYRNGKVQTLREALLNKTITTEEIVEKVRKNITNWQEAYGDIFRDGGSLICYYDTYTIIKYNTLVGNRDLYIGVTGMDIDVNEKIGR